MIFLEVEWSLMKFDEIEWSRMKFDAMSLNIVFYI